jgi:hypothetical protein
MQPLAILFGFAFTLALCCLLGAIAVSRIAAAMYREERWPIAFLLGSAMLSLILFLLCAAHQAKASVLVAIGIAAAVWAWKSGALAAMMQGAKGFTPLPRAPFVLFLLLFLPFSFAYWANSMAPEISPDGSSYHLGWVKRYAEAGGFDAPESSMYGLLSQGIEMLFLSAYLFGKHSAAAMVHWAFLLDLIWLLICFGRRIGNPLSGMAAAIFLYASPLVCIDGSSAYIDLATAAIGFGVFYLLYLWDLNPQRPVELLLAAGLLGGFSYAAKYTAAVIALWAAVFVLWNSRRKLRDFTLLAAMSLVLAAPWMLRNAVLTENPLAPFFNRWFPNAAIHIIFERQYSEWLRHYDVKNMWELPLEVTVRGIATTGALGYLFLLTPAALLALRRREGRLLLGAALFTLAPYPLNIGTRFLIPMLPFTVMALALALDQKYLLMALMTIHSFLGWPNWPPGLLKQTANQHAWHWKGIPYKAALRWEKEEDFLRRRSDSYKRARALDSMTEPGAKILGQNGIPEAYSNRDMLVGYQSATNETLTDILYAGLDESRWPRLIWIHKLAKPEGVRRVRIVQTFATEVADEQWNITEVRFFGPDGVELPRESSWKLHSNPNPWDVQMAFDNSPVTRWRSWETARPGMFVETDFGAPKNIARVEIHSSWDNPHCRTKILIEREAGKLEEVRENVEMQDIRPQFWMRREATRELLQRGVGYLSVMHDEYGSQDFLLAQQEWGIKLVGEESGQRLYRIEPYQQGTTTAK